MYPIPNAIKKLPLRSKDGFVNIDIRPQSACHRADWHTHVQPIVDSCYHRSDSRNDSRRVRADVGWSWAHIYSVAKAHDSVQYLHPQTDRFASACTLLMQNLPVGMIVFVPCFKCRLQANPSLRTFIWYLSAAPPEFYWRMHLPQPKGVALALVDFAVQVGVICAGSDGLLLRAAPGGGTALRQFYSSCEMQPVPDQSGPISPLRRWHIGEYFQMDNLTARAFSRQFDHLR